MKEDRVEDIIDMMQKLNAEEKDRLSSRLSQLERENEVKGILEKIILEAQECINGKEYKTSHQLTMVMDNLTNLVTDLKPYTY